MGRMMDSAQDSSVRTWNIVNIDFRTEPKYSFVNARGSSQTSTGFGESKDAFSSTAWPTIWHTKTAEILSRVVVTWYRCISVERFFSAFLFRTWFCAKWYQFYNDSRRYVGTSQCWRRRRRKRQQRRRLTKKNRKKRSLPQMIDQVMTINSVQ